MIEKNRAKYGLLKKYSFELWDRSLFFRYTFLQWRLAAFRKPNLRQVFRSNGASESNGITLKVRWILDLLKADQNCIARQHIVF